MESITRGDFLKGALGAAAVAGVIGAAGAQAAESPSTTGDAEAANDGANQQGTAKDVTASVDAIAARPVMDIEKVFHGAYQVNMDNVDPIPTLAEPDSYDYDADVLVIGYGVGGTSAALTAANNGASVVVLERSLRKNWSEHAGVHVVSMAGVQEWLDAAGIEKWDRDEIIRENAAYSMSKADLDATVDFELAGPVAFEQIRSLGKGCQFQLAEIFPEWRGWPTMIPLDDGIERPEGYEPTPNHGDDNTAEQGSIYYPWQNKYHEVEHRIDDYVEANGGTVLWGTPASNLICDANGRVCGARAVDPDGNEIFVHAKSVIDCVGGMGANYDMCKYYGMVDEIDGCHVGPLVDDGAGQRMCQGAGAGVRGLPRVSDEAEGGLDAIGLGLPWTLPHDNAVTRAAGLADKQFSVYTYAPIQLGRQPVLKVNKYGYRYMNENQDWDAKIWENFQQPGHRFYTIYDSHIDEIVQDLNDTRYGMCEYFVTPTDYIYFDDDDIRPLWDWKDEIQDGLDKGYIYKCDTLEELAEKLGINYENLQATVDRYNEMCEQGVDEDYGKDAAFLWPVKDPPFYGMERMAGYTWSADGGVATNSKGQVMTEGGTVIPGLYCGSNDAKITDHETYTNMELKPTCGGAHFAITMGYLAGKQAAEDAKALQA